MFMRRFFTEPENIIGNTAYVFEDSKHIEKVLRMKCGDDVLIFDGTGCEYVGRLVSIEKNKCCVEILNKMQALSEPEIKISLFQGIPKSGKMESIIQKAVELGVYEIFPVEMERCVVKIGQNSVSEKVKRWNKVSVEAVKQCGRGIIPKVHEPITFEVAVKLMQALELPLMPYELLGHAGEKSLNAALSAHANANSFGLLIGPEGGFSDDEANHAQTNGIIPIGLGKRILRTETVSSALIPIIMFWKNEL